MQGNILTESKYRQLTEELRGLLMEGRRQAEAFVQRRLIETYWQVGKRLAQADLTQNAGYGDSVYERLSQDLGIALSTLRRSVLFFETYKISAPRGTNLTWSHYRELLALPDAREREFYEKLASQQGLTRNELLRVIRRGSYDAAQSKGTRKAARLKRPSGPTYVYKAVVERVIDGDTLLLRIDLGFTVWKLQRIRLAGVDAPAAKTPGGEATKRFVQERLASVDFVMVKTNRVDIYGRYLGHIFYSTQETDRVKIVQKGTYLNQELLNRNLAGMV